MSEISAPRRSPSIDPLLAACLLGLCAGGLVLALFASELAAAYGGLRPAFYLLLLPVSALLARLLQLQGRAPAPPRRLPARQRAPRRRPALRRRRPGIGRAAALAAAVLAPLPR